jgi:HEAT repeat protein
MRARLLLLLAATAPASLLAQGLARRVAAVPTGTVRFHFATRPDVCGDGDEQIRWGDEPRRGSYRNGRWSDCPCEHGPARVTLRLRDGRVDHLRVKVGVERDSVEGTDLGQVPTREAVSWLLAVAADGRNGAADDAVFPAVLADSIGSWAPLFGLARNQSAPRKSRTQAVFWLSQAAGDQATAGLTELAESDDQDREVRKQAVFGLSQLPKDQGVPSLIRVARGNRDPEIRRNAIFWLGQSDDPRALALFEELLTRR